MLAGPYVGFYLGYKRGSNGPNDSIFSNHKDFFLENFKKVSFGLNLGGGMEIRTSLPVKFLIEARYCPDLITTFSSENVKIKNKSFEILAGVKF